MNHTRVVLNNTFISIPNTLILKHWEQIIFSLFPNIAYGINTENIMQFLENSKHGVNYRYT
jgi:hypothetical protein